MGIATVHASGTKPRVVFLSEREFVTTARTKIPGHRHYFTIYELVIYFCLCAAGCPAVPFDALRDLMLASQASNPQKLRLTTELKIATEFAPVRSVP
jgi:hypothetical protein